MANSISITFISYIDFASLNGSDKESDNISSIKKITKGNDVYPYLSSQALRRALRDQIKSLKWELSKPVAGQGAGAAMTAGKPAEFIDDDLFGYMQATQQGQGATKRTSCVRVTPLIALTPYQGDLDFGTNYMGVQDGGNPNIFETEIHSGMYRSTIFIELDRIGKGEGFKEEISTEEKTKRVKALITAIKNLWSSGRQTRFLADISPKFVVATYQNVKNPIFLEAVKRNDENKINAELIEETLKDYKEIIVDHAIGLKSNMPLTKKIEGTSSVGVAFDKITGWVDQYYNN